jgi:thioredoxin reductase
VIRTVDLIVAGGGDRALAAAAAALPRGWRVLVLLPSGDRRDGRRFRRRLRTSIDVREGQLVVRTNVAVVCVDGVEGVEVVVIRDARSGRLSAVNASAFEDHREAARRRRDGRPR